jgi:hypothetical protein
MNKIISTFSHVVSMAYNINYLKKRQVQSFLLRKKPNKGLHRWSISTIVAEGNH